MVLHNKKAELVTGLWPALVLVAGKVLPSPRPGPLGPQQLPEGEGGYQPLAKIHYTSCTKAGAGARGRQ